MSSAQDVGTQSKDPVVVDLGKQKKKQVKKLRKGQGGLMRDVQDVIAELRAAGTIEASSQPVVIVVREKRRRTMSGMF